MGSGAAEGKGSKEQRRRAMRRGKGKEEGEKTLRSK